MKHNVSATQPADIQQYHGQEGDLKFAGIHLLVELWQARHLKDVNRIQDILGKLVEACGATMLNIDLHVFSPNGGVSGVALLKESHISIHTWPEYEYAAIDVFVCGTIDPQPVLPVLEKEFEPIKMEVQNIKRGLLP